MRATLRGLAGSVTSTMERPVEIPVSANRRPPAVVYPQLPAPESAADPSADASARPSLVCPAPAWFKAASSRWASSVMLRAALPEAEGEGAADGVLEPSEPQPERARRSASAGRPRRRR